MNATWYKGGGNRRPQVFENDGFPSFFKNFGVQRSTPVERNLVLNEQYKREFLYRLGKLQPSLTVALDTVITKNLIAI